MDASFRNRKPAVTLTASALNLFVVLLILQCTQAVSTLSHEGTSSSDLIHAAQKWVQSGRVQGLQAAAASMPSSSETETELESQSSSATTPLHHSQTQSSTISHQAISTFHRPSIFGSSPSASTPKIFGVGLSKTGTTSLHQALSSMGLRCVHWDKKLLNALQHRWESTSPDLSGWYDDVDCVSDLPTATHLEELKAAYPNAFFIVTHRDVDEWYDSFIKFLKVVYDDIGAPISQLRIHERVYGSASPNEALWKQNYLQHYERVNQIIPKNQMLWLEMNDLRKSDYHPFTRLCEFMSIPATECPSEAAWPRANTIQQLQEKKQQAITSIERSKHDEEELQTKNKVEMDAPRSEYAYVTFLGGAGEGSADVFRSQYSMAAMVWCQSVRATYIAEGESQSDSRKFDMVLLTLDSDLSASQLRRLRRCFDRILHIPVLGRAPANTPDTEFWAAVRSKFAVFGLKEYRRVIAMDADHVVVKNLDDYFFRWYYEANARNKDLSMDINVAVAAARSEQAHGESSTPRMLYSPPHPNVPVDSNFWSLQPSKQVMQDLYLLLQDANFNRVSGWNEFGPVSTPNPSTAWAPRVDQGRLKQLHATPTMYSASDLVHAWESDSTVWRLETAWADFGVALYNFYLLTPELGGFIHPEDAQRSFIHYHGSNKPWMHTAESVRQAVPEDASEETRERAEQWVDAISYWQKLASEVDEADAHEDHAEHRRFSPEAFQAQISDSLRESLRPRFTLFYVFNPNFLLSPTSAFLTPGATLTLTITDTADCQFSSTCTATSPVTLSGCTGSIPGTATVTGRQPNSLVYTAPSTAPAGGVAVCSFPPVVNTLTVTFVTMVVSVTPSIPTTPSPFTLEVTFSTTAAVGTVAFTVDGASVASCNAVPVSSGTAVCSGATAAAGAHTVSATYQGTGAFASLSITDSGTFNVVSPVVVVAEVSNLPTTVYVRGTIVPAVV